MLCISETSSVIFPCGHLRFSYQSGKACKPLTTEGTAAQHANVACNRRHISWFADYKNKHHFCVVISRRISITFVTLPAFVVAEPSNLFSCIYDVISSSDSKDRNKYYLSRCTYTNEMNCYSFVSHLKLLFL